MICELHSPEACRAFVEELLYDPEFSQPMLSEPGMLENKLLSAFGRPDETVLGVYRDDALIGLFVFLLLNEERYAEMLVGLSRDAAAYAEVFDRLRTRCAGYLADFVFNPANRLLRARLEAEGAAFDAEQMKMTLADTRPAAGVDARGVEPLSERTMPQYAAMHATDTYWTAEKAAAAPERFRILVALEGETVAGYLDVTNCFDENEIYDLRVMEAYRRRGWGRKLLARAIERNRPKGMMLLVEVDNAPAVRLYEGLGFTPVPGQNSVTAHWRIK